MDAMSAALTEADIRAVRAVMDIVLRPNEFSDLESWRRESIDSLKRAVGADAGTFVLHGPSMTDQTGDYEPESTARYGISIEAVAPNVDIWARHAAFGVHMREELFLPICPEYYETAYFNEFLRPIRAFDSLGATWYLGGPPSEPWELAQILLHHRDEKGPRFGPRERQLVELVATAFQVGTEHALSFKNDTERLLDAVDVPAVLLDAAGTALHVNHAARKLFNEASILEALVLEAGRTAVRAHGPSGLRGEVSRCLISSTIGPIELGFSRIALGGVRGTGRVMTLRVKRASSDTGRLITAGRARGLTPRQSEVASHMARRQSSKEIAKRLGISVHTVRRHEEAVLAGLRISRRTDVSSELGSGNENT